MNRRLLLALVAAPALAAAAPAARAQTAEADWNVAYRLVLNRDWARADTALTAFLALHPENANAPAARFWTCFVSEQQSRLADAYGCYRAEASARPADRWTSEARTRLVAVAARLPASERPTVLTLGGAPATTVRSVGGSDGRSYVITTGPTGEADTLFFRGRGAEMDSVLRVLDAQRIRLGEQAGVLYGEAQRPGSVATSWSWNSGRSSTDDLPSDERIAVLAVEALGRRGDDAAVPDLADLAETGATAAVRGAALSALGRIGTPEAARSLLAAARRAEGLTPEAYQGLVNALARTASNRPGTPGVVDELERIARIPGLRVGAVNALSGVGTDEAERALARLADDTALAADVRRASVEGLSRRGTAQTVPLLVRYARSPDAALSRAAVEGLARIDAPEARAALLSLARLRR